MKALYIMCWLTLLAGRSFAQERILLDSGWHFFRGGATGAETVGYDYSHWRAVDLPHDWSIEDLPGTKSPFNARAISQVNGGFTEGGTGWYKKDLFLGASTKGKVILLQFEGVYMNSDIWINGHHLGNHPNGYSGFEFDISRFVEFGKTNTISVEVKNEGVNSRWYSGSGIYRHVWLAVNDPVYIDPLDVSVVTRMADAKHAGIILRAMISSKDSVALPMKVTCRILNRNNQIVAAHDTSLTISPGATNISLANLQITDPGLWSPESPELYRCRLELTRNHTLFGFTEVNFGIREIRYSATEGLLINGKPVKLKGGCVHHDNGPLGAVSFDRAEERKIQLLKASGFNAVRSAHNPPAPAFLNACDREGMLVIDEAFDMWREAKNPYDYHLYFDQWWKSDLENMVKRDRNHPSVILWSIGNEIPERWSPAGVKTASMLAGLVHSLDATRPVTSAVQDVRPDKDLYFAVHDIAGYNYGYEKYQEDHARVPSRVVVSTESYALDAFEYWMAAIDNPWVIGDFVWAGFDYMGEASIGWLGHPQTAAFYPWNLAYCGDLDVCGWKRPQSFYRDALWKSNSLALFVAPPVSSFDSAATKPLWSRWYWHDHLDDWNWAGYEGKTIKVIAYSSCETAELFINGRSLGKKPTNRESRFMAQWEVPYEAGEIKVIGYSSDGKNVNSSFLRSSGNATKLSLTADRQILSRLGTDLAYITIDLTDDNGVRNPKAETLLQFRVDGPASVAGIGNGNPRSTESFQGLSHKAWRGKCLVIVKTKKQSGTIHLTVSGKGLAPATIEIKVK